MDKISWAMAVAGAAAASLAFGGALGPQTPVADDAAPLLTAPGAVHAECGRDAAPRNVAPSVVPPAGPSDVQVNASGTGAAGGAGTVPGDARGDPCEAAKRYGTLPRAASAASISTPTTLNRR